MKKSMEAAFLAFSEDLRSDQTQFTSDLILILGCHGVEPTHYWIWKKWSTCFVVNNTSGIQTELFFILYLLHWSSIIASAWNKTVCFWIIATSVAIPSALCFFRRSCFPSFSFLGEHLRAEKEGAKTRSKLIAQLEDCLYPNIYPMFFDYIPDQHPYRAQHPRFNNYN